ncbi:MAG: hypothetical protein KDB72_07865 [Mycobacterium sp.]|nr:hypothetical protein [Mycobacterium sp.]
MRIELPYVTVTVDDGVRDRLAYAGERLRLALTAYLRNAADDVDGLGRKASAACQTAARRVDSAMTVARDRVAAEQSGAPTLKVV